MVCIGMEKTVTDRHSRRHSTGNLLLELTGYEDVLSRYLSAPFPSCHDNCKPHPPGSDHPTQLKSTRKRSTKTDPNSHQGIKKTFTPIPRSPTRHAKINTTSLPKHQVKSQPLKSKSQDFKSKSEETDPFYIPPTRINRRYSDVNLHTNDLGDVHGGSVRNSKRYDKKIDSRKDVKPVKSSVKTLGDGTVAKKVQPLKTLSGSTKLGVDHGSTKSKSKPADPVGEVVQEKNSKNQSFNEKRVLQNGAQTGSKSEKDETLKSQSQSQSQSQRVLQNGAQTASKSEKDETLGSQSHSQSQSQSQRVLQNGAQTATKLDKDETLGSQSQSNGSMAVSEGKKLENPTRVRKLAKKNEELSSQKLKFKQGKIIESQSKSNGPTKVNFEKGKVLEESQTGQEEGKSLRRLSSDGVVDTPESSSVSVVLKHSDVEVEKQNTRLNNVIEETASRLIRTRKSKVQALVGAFEMISTNEFN